jgi:hypothetical protein
MGKIEKYIQQKKRSKRKNIDLKRIMAKFEKKMMMDEIEK